MVNNSQPVQLEPPIDLNSKVPFDDAVRPDCQNERFEEALCFFPTIVRTIGLHWPGFSSLWPRERRTPPLASLLGGGAETGVAA